MIQLSCLHKSDLFDCNQNIVCFRPAKRFRAKFLDFYHLVSFALPPYYPIVVKLHTLHFTIKIFFLVKDLYFLCFGFFSSWLFFSLSALLSFFCSKKNLFHVENTITFYSKMNVNFDFVFCFFEKQFQETLFFTS